MFYSDRIKSVRKDMGWSQSDLAKILNTSVMSVSRLESGERDIKGDELKALININININWLITGQGEMFLGRGEVSSSSGLISKQDEDNVIWIPFVDVSVSAGFGIENFEDFPHQKMVAISLDLIGVPVSDQEDCIAFKVVGNSMQPRINHGDGIIVQKIHGMPLYFEGSFLVNYGGQLFVKNIQFQKGRVILRSLNKDYDDIIIENQEESEVPLYIIGRVLTSFRPF